ncbi:hypothetical protein T439DRAFT_380741 [Meredithblackwellia eburnea MCA 4105]
MEWLKEQHRINTEARQAISTWLGAKDKKSFLRSSVSIRHWWKWVVFLTGIAAVICLAVFRPRILRLFEPHRVAVEATPGSWAVAIAVLIVLSFPPLFGHEVVNLIIGLIWGVRIGVAVSAVGTVVGELLCFCVFKYVTTSYAERYEHSKVWYGCLAKMMREGSIGILLLIRFSLVPGHVVTAIMSTTGVPLWKYTIAILLSLPKQWVVVYLGYLFGLTDHNSTPEERAQERRTSLSLFFLTAIASLVSVYFVLNRAWMCFPDVQKEFEERERRLDTEEAEEQEVPRAAAEERTPLLNGAAQGTKKHNQRIS